MNEKAIIKLDADAIRPMKWQVLRLPEILAIFGMEEKSSKEKCRIWTL